MGTVSVSIKSEYWNAFEMYAADLGVSHGKAASQIIIEFLDKHSGRPSEEIARFAETVKRGIARGAINPNKEYAPLGLHCVLTGSTTASIGELSKLQKMMKATGWTVYNKARNTYCPPDPSFDYAEYRQRGTFDYDGAVAQFTASADLQDRPYALTEILRLFGRNPEHCGLNTTLSLDAALVKYGWQPRGISKDGEELYVPPEA